MCLYLARAGARVGLGFLRDEESAQATVQEIRSQQGRAIAVAADVADRDSMELLFGETRQAFGPIDIVVINAGVWKRAPIEEMTDQQWRETLDINLRSAYLACQLSIPEMKKRRSGNIICVSSTAGQRGEPFYSHYAASKGALIAMTKALAAEVGPHNIRVNCVAPGWVDTDMTRAVFSDPEFRESVRQIIPLKRIAKPEDVAGVVVFLASDLSRHVHGEVINVNGGSVLCG